MWFKIIDNDGEHVTEVDMVEIQTVDLEVDNFPNEYLTSGTVEMSITIQVEKATLLTYFKHNNDYIVDELFGGKFYE